MNPIKYLPTKIRFPLMSQFLSYKGKKVYRQKDGMKLITIILSYHRVEYKNTIMLTLTMLQNTLKILYLKFF